MFTRLLYIARPMAVVFTIGLTLSLASCSKVVSTVANKKDKKDSKDSGAANSDDLGPPESPQGAQPLGFEIRPPKAYKRGITGSLGEFGWDGEIYKGRGNFSQIRHFRVRILKARDKATSESELERELAQMTKERYDGLRPGKPETVVIGGNGQIAGIDFLRCEYAFDDKIYDHKISDVGPGTGFLYVAVTDGCTVMMDADELEVGSPEKLRIADAAARTFISYGPRQSRYR